MNVLSLFDGISCGMVALQRAGIEVDTYYASEIDPDALEISDKNFPDIVRLGDITKWRDWWIPWDKIDLVIGGSPCQGFSFAGKQLNFNDPRSKLFFEYADILNYIKSVNPDVKFLLENVRMKQEYKDVISQFVGVQPIEINSALVSAQNRKRLYWTNIEGVKQPEDKNIMLSDIVHENCWDEIDLEPFKVPIDKSLKILEAEHNKRKIGFFGKDSQANRVYSIHGKAVTLTGTSGGGAAKMGQYLFGCITPDRINKKQNGQRFSNGEKFYTLTAQDQHGVLIGSEVRICEYDSKNGLGKERDKSFCLRANDSKGLNRGKKNKQIAVVSVNGYIRKITPVECERLQTLPDGYTEVKGLSNSKRYKVLGNGWTVDVIAHIFSYLKGV